MKTKPSLWRFLKDAPWSLIWAATLFGEFRDEVRDNAGGVLEHYGYAAFMFLFCWLFYIMLLTAGYYWRRILIFPWQPLIWVGLGSHPESKCYKNAAALRDWSRR